MVLGQHKAALEGDWHGAVDVNNASLASDMVGGLGLAWWRSQSSPGCCFGARPWWSGLITNLLPLVMIAAVMVLGGRFEGHLIIFTVAFGIAVDDTIHFLSKLRLQLGHGNTPGRGQTQLPRHRKAIVVTSLIYAGDS